MAPWDGSRTHSKSIRPTANPCVARVCCVVGQMGQINATCSPFPARAHAHARVAVICKLRPIRPICPKADACTPFSHGSFLKAMPCGGRHLAPIDIWMPFKEPFPFPNTKIPMDNPTFAFTADELAACFSITARRVRQLAEDRDLPRLGRGTFDVAWLCYLLTGRKIMESATTKLPATVYVAIGWSSAIVGANGERQAFIEMFERNGLPRDEALIALGAAQGRQVVSCIRSQEAHRRSRMS